MTDRAIMESVLVVLLVSDFLLLGSSRFRTCIRLVALQGIALGILPVLLDGPEASIRAWLLAGGSILLKGVVFPFLLLRVLRESRVRREARPFVGHSLAILIGVGVLVFSLWVGSTLDLPTNAGLDSSLLVSSGLATLLIGLFLTISRRTALSQVLGYIVVENGIYTFGVVLVGGVPALVELGVLMDAFVAVFIMSIAAYHISREFEHINVDQLDRLKG